MGLSLFISDNICFDIMKSDPLISVIIPVYNVEKYIGDCVNSVLQQKYTNLEIILINDGSTDTSGQICDGYACKDSRIKVIHKDNGGLSEARNFGIDIASGEYVTFIDSDDYILPTFIEYLYDLISKSSADISVCQLINVDEKNNILSNGGESVDKVVRGNTDCMKEYLSGTSIDTVAWRKLYRKDLFKPDIRYPVGKYHEDVWTTYKLIAQCETIAIGCNALYAYRQRTGSIVNSSFSPKHLDSVYGALERQKFIEYNYPALSNLSSVGIIYAANMCLLKMIQSKSENINSYLLFLQPLYRNYLGSYLKSNVRIASKIFAVSASISISSFAYILKKIW